MNTLEKLGINAKSAYEHLLTGNRARLGWHFWKFYAWPAYSEMLEALIDDCMMWYGIIPKNSKYREDYKIKFLYDNKEKLNSIEKATGKTWDEISKLLEVVE